MFLTEQIPYVDSDTYVAYNNEKGGVIESLKEDNIVNLDSEVQSLPEWVSTVAMINSWLLDAMLYELWVGSDGSAAQKIYYSDLPWPIGKLLYLKQVHNVKQLLGISKDTAERRKDEVLIPLFLILRPSCFSVSDFLSSYYILMAVREILFFFFW